MTALACNPRTWKVKTAGSETQSGLELTCVAMDDFPLSNKQTDKKDMRMISSKIMVRSERILQLEKERLWWGMVSG